MSFLHRLGLCVSVSVLATTGAVAQSSGTALRALTADDYARAEKLMIYNTTPLVLHSIVRPTWLPWTPADPSERFWYRTTSEKGAEAVLVDAVKGTRSPCDLPVCKATERDDAPRPSRYGELSPDGRRTAFVRDWNLWVRDEASGRETPLTKDGVKDFGYATDNAGWVRSDRPIVKWSPDSTKIATFQQDQRGVGEMYLVDTKVGHPSLQAWKYPLPGDAVVTMIQRVIVDVNDAKVVRLDVPADQHRSSLCDDVVCRGEWGDAQWSADGTHLAFVSTTRDHKGE